MTTDTILAPGSAAVSTEPGPAAELDPVALRAELGRREAADRQRIADEEFIADRMTKGLSKAQAEAVLRNQRAFDVGVQVGRDEHEKARQRTIRTTAAIKGIVSELNGAGTRA